MSTGATGETLTVRMYNVGFGDCFLITLPGPRTILVDSGFHNQGKGAFDSSALAKQVVGDAAKATGGRKRIDVVIATHRHADHIWAFNSSEWNELEVGEVWMPWVEERGNKKAESLWKKHRAFALRLAAAAPTFRLDSSQLEELEFLLWNAGVDLLHAAWSNGAALDMLHDGFARRDRATPRFLPSSGVFPETFETDALPGVQVSVLGPPRNDELLKQLDPERDGETYHALMLRAAKISDPSADALQPPFSGPWLARERPPLRASELKRLQALARSVDPLFAARALDSMANSTSLVLMLQIGAARLLLPGDAEWATWKLILDNENACSLLRGTTFFKVGHHGSQNATPKTLVESVLPRNVSAMVSTQEGTGQFRKGIPLGELLDALKKHGVTVVRSDVPPKDPPRGFSIAPRKLWVDLTLPM